MGRYFQKCCDLFCGRLKCSLFLLSMTPILYGASFTKPSTNTHTQAAKNVLRMEDFLVDVRKLAEEASFLKAFYVFPAKIDFVGELCAVFTVVSVVGGSGTPELCRTKALLIGNPYPNSLLRRRRKNKEETYWQFSFLLYYTVSVISTLHYNTRQHCPRLHV